MPTAQEVLMWQLINRARLDPGAEAARFGISLNEGLAAGTLAGSSRQPLAFNAQLEAAADLHSQRMVDFDFTAHNDPFNGSTPNGRIAAAGYAFSWWGENISQVSSSGAIDATAAIVQQHANLFIDANWAGRGHRLNILNDNFQEVGIGQALGVFNNLNSSLVTQDFARPSTAGPFITGVVYNDLDSNNFYSVGDGLGGVSVTYTGGSTATQGPGNYAARVAANTTVGVTFSGGGLTNSASLQATIGSSNAELDIQLTGGTTVLRTSVSVTETAGIGRIVGLGTNGLQLAGDDNGDFILGTSGGDTLRGNGGNDVLNGLGGADRIFADAGDDYVYYDAGDVLAEVLGGSGFDTLIVQAGTSATGFNLAAHEFERGRIDWVDTAGQAWSTVNQYFQPGWTLDYNDTFYDNGTRQVQVFDTGAPDSWSSYIDYYNAGGQLTGRRTINDNGTYSTTFFDLAGQSWKSYTDYNYGPQNQLTARQTINDNNSYSNTFFDALNQNSWSQYTDHFNATGTFIGRTGVWDNGTLF